MFVAIKSNEFYAVYLVNVDTMTKTFTSNVRNSEGLQVVNQEFLNHFNDVTPKTVSIDDCLNTIEMMVDKNRARHRKNWNRNVDKINNVINILFSI